MESEQIAEQFLGTAPDAEAVLRKGEHLLDAFGIGCVAIDREGRIRHWSAGATEIFGFSAQEAIGLGVTELPGMSPEVAASLRVGLLEDIRSPMEADVLLLRKDGSQFPARVRTIAGRDASGEHDGAVNLVTDLSRSAVDRAAHASASRSAAVAEISRLSVAGLDQAEFRDDAMRRLAAVLDIELVALLNVDRANGILNFAAGCGWDDGVIGGAGLAVSNPDVDCLLPVAKPVLVIGPGFEPPADGLLAAHGVRSGLAVAVGTSPSVGALVVLSRAQRDFGQLEIDLLRSVSLVLEAAATRERARELEQRFERVSRMEAMGQLTGGIAHDFNNLLAVIINYAAFAREEAYSNADVDPGDSIQEIEVAARRAAELTHQLLVFSRQEVVETAAVDIGSAVFGAQELVARTLGEEITLQTDVEPGLPTVEIGPGQIEQIVVNLAVNARDAMPDGGELRIEVTGAGGGPGGRWVMVKVTDTGSGMPREVIEKAFEPFFTTKDVGSGLGLATVYGVVSAVGGSVELRSDEGAGTTVDIALPATEDGDQASPIPAEASEQPTGVSADGPSAARILLVEDDPMVRRLAVRVLEEGGFAVRAADDASEALALISDQGDSFDVILSDVVMPEVSGPELIERARAVRPDLRVVFMSGYAGDSLSPDSIRDATLVEKPFTPATLLASVRQALT